LVACRHQRNQPPNVAWIEQGKWYGSALFDVRKSAGTNFGNAGSLWESNQEMTMSVKGQIKEAAGYVKEEAYEHGKSADSKIKAQEGRELRNEGRVEDGKTPKTAEPGKRHQ
jgi:hypothetical protein